MQEAFGKPAASSGKLSGGREKVGTKRALGRGLYPRSAPWAVPMKCPDPAVGDLRSVGCPRVFLRRQVELQFCQIRLDSESAF